MGLCTRRVSFSLRLPSSFPFPFSSSYSRSFVSPKAASVGQEPSLDCLVPGRTSSSLLFLSFFFIHLSFLSLSLSFSLFLSHSSRSTVNATIMFAVRPTGDGRDLSIEFPGNSVWQGRLKRRVNGRERERRRALSQQDNDRMQNRGVSTDSRGVVPFLATVPFLVPFAFRAAPFSPLTFPTLYADFGNLVNSLMPRRTDHRADKERRSE